MDIQNVRKRGFFGLIPERLRRSLPLGAFGAGILALTPLLGSSVPAEEAERNSGPPALGAVEVEYVLARTEERAERLDRRIARAELAWEERVQPIAGVLSRFHPDEAHARRIALALVREGDRAGIDPRVLVSVLLVENPWLDPEAESPVGAVGLMQVMPFHAGEWECGSADLTDLDANICHGTRIFAHYMERTGGDLDRALLRYNGCVNGTNTPDCHLYPRHVYARAGRSAVLAWLDGVTGIPPLLR